jgi:phosphatidylethanolamine-binding protein (PEBP) family uncharacterized protein
MAWDFVEKSRGADAPSPEIVLTGLPKEACRVTFTMRDLDRPAIDHGGGGMKFEKGTEKLVVPTGKLKRGYNGPRPPSGETHKYALTAKIYEENDKVLAEVTEVRPFK